MAKSVATEPGTQVAVATTSTQVIPADASRIEVTICNDSDTTVYLALGPTAVLNRGIRLNSAGGSYTTNDYNGAITAIHGASGTKILTVVGI